ncbi:MAG: hypothetical protein AAFN79_08835 [Pseudomonadota bacterium]
MLKGAIVGAAGASLSTPAIAQSTITLTAVSIWPTADAGPGALAGRFADRMATLTDGRIRIEMAEWNGDALSLYRATGDGQVDICFAAEDLWAPLNPSYGLFASPPGGLTAGEFEGWIAWGGGGDAWNALAEQSGVAPFLIGDRGLSPALTSRAFDAEDLPTVTVAASGLAAQVWEKAGAGRVVGEDQAASAAICNAADCIDVYSRTPGVYGARYDVAVNHVNNALSMNVNRSALSRLSDSDRKLMKIAANAEHIQQRGDAMMRSLRASAADGALGALPAVATPPGLATALLFASSAVLEEVGAHDRYASDAVWSLQLHAEDAAAWSAIGEGAFLEARARNGGGAK